MYMHFLHTKKPHHAQGFTLIETMIVVLVMSILVTLAAPSYVRFLDRAHRTQAIGQLMGIATCQERIRASTGGYDTSRCLPGDSAHYRFTYRETDQTIPLFFQLAAQPLGSQTSDPCGELVLDSLGRRSVGMASADTTRCWSGR